MNFNSEFPIQKVTIRLIEDQSKVDSFEKLLALRLVSLTSESADGKKVDVVDSRD